MIWVELSRASSAPHSHWEMVCFTNRAEGEAELWRTREPQTFEQLLRVALSVVDLDVLVVRADAEAGVGSGDQALFHVAVSHVDDQIGVFGRYGLSVEEWHRVDEGGEPAGSSNFSFVQTSLFFVAKQGISVLKQNLDRFSSEEITPELVQVVIFNCGLKSFSVEDIHVGEVQAERFRAALSIGGLGGQESPPSNPTSAPRSVAVCVPARHEFEYQIFVDIALSIMGSLNDSSFSCVLIAGLSKLDESCTIIVLGPHLFSVADMRPLPQSTVFYNFEPLGLGGTRLLGAAVVSFLATRRIWDYDSCNVTIWKESYRAGDVCHVPVVHHRSWNRSAITRAANKEYDILFYGSLNPRREDIIGQLELSGLKVKVLTGVYGEDLYESISKSRLVLNLGFYDASRLETPRLMLLWENCVPVLSEDRSGNTLREAAASFFVPIEEMVLRTTDLLSLSDNELLAEASDVRELITTVFPSRLIVEALEQHGTARPADCASVSSPKGAEDALPILVGSELPPAEPLSICFAHTEPTIPLHLVDIQMGLGAHQGETVVSLQDVSPLWSELYPYAYSASAIFSVPALLETLNIVPDHLMISQYRKFISRRVIGTESASFPGMRMIDSTKVPRGRPLPSERGEFLVPSPLLLPQGILAHYEGCHRVADLLELCQVALEGGVLRHGEVTSLLMAEAIVPGAMEVGIYPTWWYVEKVRELEDVCLEFIHRARKRIDTYRPLQRRALASGIERFFSWKILQELSDGERHGVNVKDQCGTLVCVSRAGEDYIPGSVEIHLGVKELLM